MVELVPSILSADFSKLALEIEAAERGGGSVIHIDIMDGHFVPNLTMGPPVVKSLRKVTNLPLDCHLMIEIPTTSSQSLRRREPTGSASTTRPAATCTAPCS